MADILELIRRAFPQTTIEGPVTTHSCAECDSLNNAFMGKRWDQLSPNFIDDNSDILPLISDTAYLMVLPAWLERAVLNPDGLVAEMLLINLSSTPRTEGATSEQARCVIEFAKYIATHNSDGAVEDSIDANWVAEVQRLWGQIAYLN